MAEIKRLEWDSDFFGIEVGEWIGDGIAESAGHFDLLYRETSALINEKMPGFECSFLEQKLIFGKDLLHTVSVDNAIRDYSSEKSTMELYQLAYESGKYSRFKLDPRMKSDDFERMYRLWLDNSVSKTFATGVLIYQIDEIVAGFVTYAIKGRVGNIGLIAVSPSYQGRGIGKKLVTAVESALISNGIFELQIPTQSSNIEACAFYKKLGYNIIMSKHIKHFWK
ncbi:MAG: GNAT family N-acetyltransferase [Flavobacterium sp.]|nr:GNAT family N-acetyltransferase [Flavobacterium sp.]